MFVVVVQQPLTRVRSSLVAVKAKLFSVAIGTALETVGMSEKNLKNRVNKENYVKVFAIF